MKNNDSSMKNLAEYLISTKTVGNKIIDEYDVMVSTLNAEFIRRMEKDQLLEQIFNLDQIINQYSNRKKRQKIFMFG